MADDALLGALSHLLHDASLERVVADGDTVSMFFECLRRNVDGTELDDRIVELRFGSVSAVAIAYDPPAPSERPSTFEVPEAVRLSAISPWPEPSVEGDIGVSSRADRENVELAAVVDWLHGSLSEGDASPATFSLAFERGSPPVAVKLWMAFAGVSAFAGGVPLGSSEWTEQHAAWWRGWQQHWDSNPPVESERPVAEDAVIPLAEDPVPDLGYEHPREPAFELEPTDAPPEILAPVRSWFESLFERDWKKRASVYRDLDQSLDAQAKYLAEAGTTHEFGTWGYARAVDAWWVEGRRGFLRVRGIEHSMPVDDEPASSCETVWDFSLCEREGAWFIRGYSQGWPRYGSAEQRPASDKPWLSRWKAGAVES